jgi:hypothetical protein
LVSGFPVTTCRALLAYLSDVSHGNRAERTNGKSVDKFSGEENGVRGRNSLNSNANQYKDKPD